MPFGINDAHLCNKRKIMMNVAAFTCNPFQENGYIISDETNECIIIDPGCYTASEQQQYLDYIQQNNLKPVRLFNTHCHLDHICGNAILAKKFNLKLEAHQGEKPVLDASPQHGAMYGFRFEESPAIEVFLAETDTVQFGNSELSILYTPGHSPASISFYSEKEKFVIGGDVLFLQSIGRTDLPGGDYDTLINSIQTQLFTLPDEVKVYSGHGPATTIGFEKMNNPFFV
ncbi:MAG: MBL fold metallo-hydrolase [Chitinophagales bacterium]